MAFEKIRIDVQSIKTHRELQEYLSKNKIFYFSAIDYRSLSIGPINAYFLYHNKQMIAIFKNKEISENNYIVSLIPVEVNEYKKDSYYDGIKSKAYNIYYLKDMRKKYIMISIFLEN